ncbi:translation initiation factor IF-2-like [Aquila chrysaetos chrysaetos]|uniref:translation initiation factor IF-2-like n=1 Tax=Aquila chrysaetos chrysaetos TaxID=223781 RepID=UPI0011771BFE|nr:translation initiation factor IF-2-like [Aquila chrysaetos chrysaetos]
MPLGAAQAQERNPCDTLLAPRPAGGRRPGRGGRGPGALGGPGGWGGPGAGGPAAPADTAPGERAPPLAASRRLPARRRASAAPPPAAAPAPAAPQETTPDARCRRDAPGPAALPESRGAGRGTGAPTPRASARGGAGSRAERSRPPRFTIMLFSMRSAHSCAWKRSISASFPARNAINGCYNISGTKECGI